MKRLSLPRTGLVAGLVIVALVGCVAEPAPAGAELHELARTDPDAFAAAVTRGAGNDYLKARAVVDWFANNFDWTATDYQERTVEQIIERGGGNCAELARVTTSMLGRLDLRMRKVREINFHVTSDDRQARAEEKVRERGASMSVFGRQHNDHVWIEVYERGSGAWFPADPSLGVVGEQQWLAARVAFEVRQTLDPSSPDMIVPVAVFAYDDEGNLVADRTRHYLIDGLIVLYGDDLRRLPAWSDWERGVEALRDPARGAFEGRVNLHDHGAAIAELGRAYADLRGQYLERSAD